MQKIKLSTFLQQQGSFVKVHDEIDAALNRTWLMLIYLVLSSAILLVYTLLLAH